MASWIAPKSFVDDDKLTFAELNAAMGPNGDIQWLKDALAQIGVTADSGSQTVDSAFTGTRVYGTNQQIPDSQWTEVNWSQQRFGRMDGADWAYLVSDHPSRVHLTTRSPLLALRGYYVVGAHVAFTGNTAGVRGIRISCYPVGGSTAPVRASKLREATGAGVAMALSIVTVPDKRFGGDSFVCEVYQDSGDLLALETIPGMSPEMWIAKIAVSS